MVGAACLAGALIAGVGACAARGPSAELSDTPVTTGAPSVTSISYGPDPVQLLDIYQPTSGQPVGVIIWLHAGGWISGSRAKVSELVMSQTERGWAVVSVDYRLAPAVRGDEMMADIDRAVRWVRANGEAYGLNTDTVVVSGGSAGGHLAAMSGAAAGVYVDPTLPPELRAQSPAPDGVIDLVGPADLTTFWEAGGWAPDTSSELVGCALGPTTIDLPPCEPGEVERLSPVWWAEQAVAAGRTLPPAFLAYGPRDALVPPATQGDLLYAPWDAAAPPGSTHYDLPLGGGHNIESALDPTGFETWLDKVAARSF